MDNRGPGWSRRRILLVVAGALVPAGIVLVVLAKTTPEAYRRTEGLASDEAAARFNQEVVNRIGNVLLDRSGGTRLDLEVTEEMANARIARFVADQEAAGKPVPPAVRDLRIGFEPGRVVVATRLGQGLASVVVSQWLRLEVGPDGSLCIEPAGVQAGVFPVPAAMVDGARRALAERLARDQPPPADEKTPDLGRCVIEALQGKPVFLGKGKRRILVDRAEVDRGVLKVEGHRADAPGTAGGQ